MTRAALLVATAAMTLGAARWQQPDDDDDTRVVATYHKLTGEALDYKAVAERSPRAQAASGFDRPDVVQAEAARLQALVASADAGRVFTMRVADRVSQYDHDRGEFSVGLFQPGFFVRLDVFGQEYQLVFANADGARAIAMPKEQARAFDARLQGMGRGVTTEVRFRVTGAGDPAGAVTGARVIRAELVSARLLDAQGQVVFVPSVRPSAVAAAGASAAPAFDVATVDVAGFRVGVKVRELEATLTRLFGPVERRAVGRNGPAGITGILAVHELDCMDLPGRRTRTQAGTVCVVAQHDGDDVVRSIRVERTFAWHDAEVFRRTLVARYGPVAAAQNGGGFMLGWGPEVPAPLRYGSGPTNALTAYYLTNDDFMSRGGNSLPQIRVVLQLVDVRWATTTASR